MRISIFNSTLSKNKFLFFLGIIIQFSPLLLQAQKVDIKKPNVIVILTDDMGYSDIGCYGSEIHTPNIDKLAMNGFRYTRFFNQARCSLSRASLLKGLFPNQL